MNRFNLSQMLQGAAQGLSQAAAYHGQMDMENLRAMRAENMARLQHEYNVELQERDLAGREQLQSRGLEQQGHLETQREEAMASRQRTENEAYFNRLTAAQRAEEQRQQLRLDAESQRQRQQQVAQNRQQMELELRDLDTERDQLAAKINASVNSNPLIKMIQDPLKKQQAMASDPTIAPLLEQYHTLEQNRARAVTRFTLYGASLGDPMFQGVSTDDLGKLIHEQAPPVTGAMTPPTASAGASDVEGGVPGGTATPDNPLEPPSQRPDDYPSHNPADDVEASPVGAAGAAGPSGPPVSRAAPSGGSGYMPWAPQTPPLGPVPPPQVSLAGPLRLGPQLIPQPLAPGFAFGSGSQFGGAPPLIPVS